VVWSHGQADVWTTGVVEAIPRSRPAALT